MPACAGGDTWSFAWDTRGGCEGAPARALAGARGQAAVGARRGASFTSNSVRRGVLAGSRSEPTEGVGSGART